MKSSNCGWIGMAAYDCIGLSFSVRRIDEVIRTTAKKRREDKRLMGWLFHPELEAPATRFVFWHWGQARAFRAKHVVELAKENRQSGWTRSSTKSTKLPGQECSAWQRCHLLLCTMPNKEPSSFGKKPNMKAVLWSQQNMSLTYLNSMRVNRQSGTWIWAMLETCWNLCRKIWIKSWRFTKAKVHVELTVGIHIPHVVRQVVASCWFSGSLHVLVIQVAVFQKMTTTLAQWNWWQLCGAHWSTKPWHHKIMPQTQKVTCKTIGSMPYPVPLPLAEQV